MINGSFVFGMDDDDESVFRANGGLGDRARHHDGDVPHPDALPRHAPLRAHGCSTAGSSTRDWDLYDTRHVVYRPARLTPEQLKRGYDWAYRELLPLVLDRARVAGARLDQAPGETFLLCGGLEEVRAAVGPRDSRAAARDDDAAPRGRAVEGHRYT